MAKSIIQTDRSYCYICGRNAHADYFGLEEHHVYGGYGIRPISEKYGLKVYLCHYCHNEPPNGVHYNKDIRLALQAKVQKIAIKYYKWSVDDFRAVIGRSYI